jgi:5-methylcytosine-specific restriction endonuclease McrA
MELHNRSDHELLSDVTKLVGSHREITAKLVAHLAELEELRLHLRAGFSSMFDFCVRELRMSEGEAFRRILAARLGRRFPLVLPLLASGAVHLSALELVRESLTDENHEELLEAVSGKSKREVELLLASWFPKPDAPARIRRLSERIEPLSQGRFIVEFTASAELCEKLERCRDLMSHANPSRELHVVVERAVDLLLDHLEATRLAKTKRRDPKAVRREIKPRARLNSHRPRRITAAIRRRVFERDGARCTYVAPDGRRCDGRAFLELDHVEPHALGGADTVENLRVRCRAHNRLWAEEVYGRERVKKAPHFRQQKSDSCAPVERLHELRSEASPPKTAPAVFEKVHLALRNLGFREAQARKAIVEVAESGDGPPLTLEAALRTAILVATRRAA